MKVISCHCSHRLPNTVKIRGDIVIDESSTRSSAKHRTTSFAALRRASRSKSTDPSIHLPQSGEHTTQLQGLGTNEAWEVDIHRWQSDPSTSGIGNGVLDVSPYLRTAAQSHQPGTQGASFLKKKQIERSASARIGN